MSELSTTIIELAEKYGVNVQRNNERGRNAGASAGKDIFLGEFDDADLELVSFFHELGHALLNDRVLMKRGSTMSTLSSEGTAWELGLGLAHENGYDWDYNSDTLIWARRQLRTYVDGEYDDTLEGSIERYDVEGIGDSSCIKCGESASFQWNICSDDNTNRPICKKCDIELNRLVLEWAGFDNVDEKITKYTNYVMGEKR